MKLRSHPFLPYLVSPLVVTLPSGKSIRVARCSYRFTPWRGSPISDTFGRKAVLDWRGKPVFAELAILEVLQEAGWEGVWVNAYRKKFHRSMPPSVCSVPPRARAVFESIKVEHWKGWPDVFAWKRGNYFFLEAKRARRDRIRPNMLAWLQAALQARIKLKSFLIVEWELAT